MACCTCCKQKRGHESKTSNNFTCQTRPTKSCLSHNLSKQVTFYISDHRHRKAGSLQRARNGITVVLVDVVWRMPLWQDTAHPRVLRSGTAIAGALRPQRTIGATDKRVSCHTACLPLSEASNSGEPLPALGTADKQVSWHKIGRASCRERV